MKTRCATDFARHMLFAWHVDIQNLRKLFVMLAAVLPPLLLPGCPCRVILGANLGVKLLLLVGGFAGPFARLRAEQERQIWFKDVQGRGPNHPDCSGIVFMPAQFYVLHVLQSR